MERRIKIYYLADQNGTPFYIGATIQTLKMRLSCGCYYKPKGCARWSINLIEESDLSNAAWLEKYWMDQFRAWGYTLTNRSKQQYPVNHVKERCVNRKQSFA